ncbi:MAG: hypothetical protein WCV90_00890 [Candidatus Woesearchaeota archaeon]|jgi:hypothetical protein
MPRIIDEYYIIDDSLSKNESVVNLLRLMEVSYSIKTGEARDCESLTPQEPQQIYVAEVNRVWLGLWPTQGPVEQVYFSPALEKMLRKGTLTLSSSYDHDRNGSPMVRLRLTQNRKELKRLGLEQLLPSHAISLYLQPK